MQEVLAYGTNSKTDDLKLMPIKRREVGVSDVKLDVLYCGVCHSDIHTARNEWGNSVYPVVPGHEIVGRVTEVGAKVTRIKKGDLVGIGCMVDSCRTCSSCKEDLEQYCEVGSTMTYNGPDKFLGGMTFGGYSKEIVVDEHFALSVPKNLNLSEVAPLLCAGITLWSPLKHWNVKKGDVVGIIGLGGLGHMGVKFAKAMGAHVVVLTTSPNKVNDAKDLGAHDVLISKNSDEMNQWMGKFDLLINTIPVGHDLNPYLGLLKRDATMVIVGAIEPLEKFHGGLLIGKRRQIAGSVIGGIKETQEMLDFCGEHNITSDVEVIAMQDINEAYTRTIKSDVKYRFVIDMSTLS